MKKNQKSTSVKNMQIDMSLLSSAQKQLCIKLLAQSNINFSEDKNGFSAQLKINQNQLPKEFFISKKQQNTTPDKYIEKDKIKSNNRRATQNQKSKNKYYQAKGKQNKSPDKNNKLQSKGTNQKTLISPILINNNPKKPLSKLVKINDLKKLQYLHPNVELYVYPKRMSFSTLIQVVQTIYEQYWNQKNGKVAYIPTHKKKTVKKDQRNYHLNIKKGEKIATFQNIQQQIIQKHKENQFADWVYKNYICQYPQKVKVQQTLVNLMQSLNHFCYKSKGLALFYKFLSNQYSLQIFHYFLVIRALLQQIYQDKIIDRRCNYNSHSGYTFKLKINPYQKLIQQEKVYDFLQVCCCQSAKQSEKQNEKLHRMFIQMTKRMHFDEKRKKNYISFFQMVQIFLQEFKSPTDASSNFQLSYSNNNESFNQFTNMDAIKQFHKQKNENSEESKQIQSYFQVQNLSCGIHDSLSLISQRQNNEKPFDYYIPKQQKVQEMFSQKFIKDVRNSFQEIHQKLGIQKQLISSQSKQILQCLIQSLVSMNKSKWLQLLQQLSQSSQKKNNFHYQFNESAQILFIQGLQQEYHNMLKTKILQKSSIKKILSCHILRMSVLSQVQKSLN